MTNVGALIGMGLSTMYPGENQMIKTALGAVAGNLALSLVQKLPKPDHLFRYLSPKPNAVMINQDGPIFAKLEHYIIQKYLNEIRSCELQPRNGEINLSLNELQLHKPLMDMYPDSAGVEQKVMLTLLDQDKDPGYSATSWKSLFWNFETFGGGSERTGYEKDKLGKVILISSWKLNVCQLKNYITKISDYLATAQVTVIFCAIEKDKNSKIGSGSKKGGGDVDIILDWDEIHVKSNKRMSNTIVSSDVQKKLFDDVKWFVGAESWYNDKGLPYKRGYLLSGPPGTGKTSLIKAIASEYKMKIFIIDLEIVRSNSQFSSLIKKINYLSENEPYILALEDVDRCSMFDGSVEQNRRFGLKDKDVLSMNCFLNEIDGLVETHGRLLFLTANNTSVLEETTALMRPGRIDKHIVVDYCNFDQIQRLLVHFYGLSWKCLLDLKPEQLKSAKISPASVISILQGAIDADPETILHNFFNGFEGKRVDILTPDGKEVDHLKNRQLGELLENDKKFLQLSKRLKKTCKDVQDSKRNKRYYQARIKFLMSHPEQKFKKQLEKTQKKLEEAFDLNKKLRDQQAKRKAEIAKANGMTIEPATKKRRKQA